ncbi:DUF3226 domain-containing protein [Myxococcota bacterium]
MTRRVWPYVLLVEGKDELRLLPELLELAGIPWPKGEEPVHIKEHDGVDSILAAGLIEAELKATGLKALGILVDADGDARQRWEQVRARVAQSFPSFPKDLDPQGAVYAGPSAPRVGVWVMPDNVRQGMLETMLLELRTGDQRLAQYAHDATVHAREKGACYREVHREKAELHVWLAWQDPPGLQIHMGVKAGLLAPNSQVTSGFVAWFRSLFEVCSSRMVQKVDRW